MPAPLTGAELAAALATLPGWWDEDGSLVASYRSDRAGVPALYAAVAGAEDAANHHARVTILYDTVTFQLTTHDAGDLITARDTAAAAAIASLAAEHGAVPIA
ncbi:4a-hydroxytetrahydrobiopterin dehydratase [Streptomyces sp. CBMA152]|uniref:4a-hydroxytetrahydrobiopterin dehydratase n=1 Tax=Streptomyces sp. CBMA152 TaxID=1896312 RepID=UPI001660F1F8|nr:4a-hydroxytetrahydrobiopterin dehydratase [Streptomyces sp. CBMA152]MBD0746159.1 pterin-4-alpha-carbinolamine dehydratase [Streptomyces sp. CBMA152]